MIQNHLKTPFTLPCGAIIKNRIVKSAITERISDQNLEPNEKHHHLYKLWADTGAGIIITGNVMVDPVYTESAGNVYVGKESVVPKLKAWADATKKDNNHVWVQISHAGRQTNKFKTKRPLAPSEVQLHKMGLFGKPKAMSHDDIENVINNFVKAAVLSKKAGFTGVQIHSAHGYLLSQFLSPITNKRTDQWGGSLENRTRVLLTIVERTRQEVGKDFPISVKLNSSDFQKGGFTEEESLEVIKLLEGKIDLLEVSGGTYENIVYFEDNKPIKGSTKQREAFFMEFSKKVRKVSNIPLMITGGFRSFDFCNEVLQKNELDLIGMARPFITSFTDIPDFIEGKKERLDHLVIRTGIKSMDAAAEGGFYAKQIIRLSEGKKLNLNMSYFIGSLFFMYYEFKKSLSLKNNL